MRRFIRLPKHSLRCRVMLLTTIIIISMALLDLVAAHWSLRRSLLTYSKHNQADQAQDWAQVFGVLYDEFGSWNEVKQNLTNESSLRIDGQKLGQLTAVIVLNNGVVIRTKPQAVRQSDWESSPILFRGRKVGILYMQGYISPQVESLKRRITHSFDSAQFLVVFVTSVIAFIFIVVFVRSFLKPLEQLAQSATSMTSGEFNAPLPAGGDLEIQNVVSAFAVTRKRLQEAQETRKKVLADIHHELRTPLNVIANRLEAIHLGLYQWDAQTATILHEETERIRTIVDELEQLNDVQSGEQELHIAWVSVEEWLPKLVGLFAVEANRQGVELQLVLPSKPLQIWMDKNRMSQVMINLVSNALRYTPRGKHIHIKVEQDDSGTVIQVEDEGTGIESEHLPFIFERFYRVEPSRNRKTGGAGLGLAIVQEVVNAHGGNVTVRSFPGEGTCFRIFLPNAPMFQTSSRLD